MIDFQNITMLYEGDDSAALDNLSLKIEKGEFVFLVGKSGAGKSTIIKLLLKEITPTSGKIFVAGTDISSIKERDLPYYRRNVGIVFQDYRLLETKTVYENVAFAMEAIQTSPKTIQRVVPKILNMVGLRDKARKYPSTLAGGEQQRVAIARSIVNNPKILICDEPTGNLDPITSAGIMNLLSDINRLGTTVLIATHDNTMVDRMRKRVISLRNGVLVRDEIGGYYS
ncbi:MAG: cell division ATP-binding protein FtsE [Eubacteriaceae bacterium]|nr:cell division ATP-binding protein FtsE [Eubacteriaceae bacterium]